MRPIWTSAGHANPGPQIQERDTRFLESDESQLRNACSLSTLGNTQWPKRSDRPPDSITREDIPGFLDLKRHLTLFWAKVRPQHCRCSSLHLETKRKWAMPPRDPPPSALRGPQRRNSGVVLSKQKDGSQDALKQCSGNRYQRRSAIGSRHCLVDGEAATAHLTASCRRVKTTS